jgi:hypothetical protein
MEIIPGMIVKIRTLSRVSYYLYRHYEKDSSLIICPCKLKFGALLIVEEVFEGKALMSTVGKEKRLTITFCNDLEPVYEIVES